MTLRKSKSKVLAKAIGQTKEPLVKGVDTTFRTKAALKTITNWSKIEKICPGDTPWEAKNWNLQLRWPKMLPKGFLRGLGSLLEAPWEAQEGAKLEQNRSWEGVFEKLKKQEYTKLFFATHPMRNASFCFSKGSQNEQKRIPIPLLIRVPFQLKKTASKLRFCSNLAPSWASQCAPKRPPRPLKNHSWKHLGPS